MIDGADPTVSALTGRIDVRFADTTLIDAASGGTPVDLEFGYTIGTSSVKFAAHEVYLPKPKLPSSADCRNASPNTGNGPPSSL